VEVVQFVQFVHFHPLHHPLPAWMENEIHGGERKRTRWEKWEKEKRMKKEGRMTRKKSSNFQLRLQQKNLPLISSMTWSLQ